MTYMTSYEPMNSKTIAQATSQIASCCLSSPLHDPARSLWQVVVQMFRNFHNIGGEISRFYKTGRG